MQYYIIVGHFSWQCIQYPVQGIHTMYVILQAVCYRYNYFFYCFHIFGVLIYVVWFILDNKIIIYKALVAYHRPFNLHSYLVFRNIHIYLLIISIFKCKYIILINIS